MSTPGEKSRGSRDHSASTTTLLQNAAPSNSEAYQLNGEYTDQIPVTQNTYTEINTRSKRSKRNNKRNQSLEQ